MRRLLFVLLFLAFGFVPDISAQTSDSATVSVGARIEGPDFRPAGTYIEVGEEGGQPYVISSESDPWNYLIHPTESPSGSQLLAYTQEETDALLWNGYGVAYAREQRAIEHGRLAAAERARKAAEEASGAAGDSATP